MTDPEDPQGPAAPPRRNVSADAYTDTDAGAVTDDDDLWSYDDHEHDDWDDEDYVDLPGTGSASKWVVVIAAMVLLVVLVVGGGWVWYNRQVDPPGSPGMTVSIEVPAGATVSGIGSILDDKGVISNARVFNFYAGRKGAGPFKAGTYEMQLNSDFDLALRTLAAGPDKPLLAEAPDTVSIPEGLTIQRVLDRLAERVPGATVEEMRAALDSGSVVTSLRPTDQPSYEGLLFPATYDVTDGATGVALLSEMAAEMEARLVSLGADEALARLSSEWGLELTYYDLLKVASMIQAEAGNVEEAPQIATVIYNRLAAGMALGIDAVDRYGAELAGVAVDYNDSQAAYNTRRKVGLPPTPIGAPGEFAINAALNPAVGDWLYYVLQEQRSHVFVTTNAEFLEAKRICREKDLGCG